MTRSSLVALAAAVVAAGASARQGPAGNPLQLPENVQVFGTAMPSVVKATAIVNGDVITQTDVDQRLAFLALSNGEAIPAEEIERLRQQIVRNLIDEMLQIQAARAEEIQLRTSDIDKTIERVAGQAKMTPQQFSDMLSRNGSSIATVRRQIEGEIAWQRLLQSKIESGVSVGDDEVKAVLDKMNAAKGTEEFRVGEIFLSANPANQAQIVANADQILSQLRAGASFASYARQYSEASTAAVGGDLGWVRPEMLPDPLSSVVRQMTPGSVSNPIQLPGGVSILAVMDTRRILTPDPRDATLALKQITIRFPQGTTRAVAEPIVARFNDAARNVGGCGGAERIAAEFKGEVISNDSIKMRDLPPVLQEMIMPLQVGQATQPVGSIEESVRVFVICGRDEVDPSQPSFDDVFAQLNEERVNVRARRYLRDLRRDAVIEFR